MNLNLTDQICFVAGSSRGIGRAIAAALLAEGASIVLTGRNEDSLEHTLAELATPENHTRILPIAADFTNPEAAAAALDRTVSHFGKLDHLIANLGTGAGTPGPTPPPEDWTRLFDQNFFASVRLTEAALPHLRAQGGSILYISSIVAVEATPAPLPYCAAKAALTNYAKNLSRHLAPENIRVNTIAPGNIFFPGGSWERHLANRKEAVESMLKAEVPQNRFGSPEEIASLAAYLCSPLAAFSTGSTYVMDGGQTRSL
jgi:3-oxoacyl-[acyl-carrier protein] reductase